jgi:energy-coupling factor transporter transmembrane protein EcfT
MFLKNISLGIYYPGASLLHRMQARTKLLVLLLISISLIIAGHAYWDFTPYIVALGFVGVGVVCSGSSAREIWRRLWLLTLLVCVTGLLTLLVPTYAPDGSQVLYTFAPLVFSPTLLLVVAVCLVFLIAIYRFLRKAPWEAVRKPGFQQGLKWARNATLIGIVSIGAIFLASLSTSPAYAAPAVVYMLTRDSIWYAVIFCATFVALYTGSVLLTMTTSPVALIEGLTILLTPLRWLRLPVDDFALMTLIALRFVPTLVDEIYQLVKAQAARGASFSTGTPRERLQSLLALFLPFLRNTLRRAAELSIALEARGYQIDGCQTRLHEKKLQWIDYSALCLVGGILLLVLLI